MKIQILCTASTLKTLIQTTFTPKDFTFLQKSGFSVPSATGLKKNYEFFIEFLLSSLTKTATF